ncbi:MAG TPA: glycosyltransferase family 39 protein [Vicinamibacteria bacterium]|nr:glycosyltransferase family 39 protein [Vicinamibacteria bacterium]
MRRRWPAVVAAAAVALQVGLTVSAMRGNTATFDEGAHLPAGWTHLALGDHRLNPEQPPLLKLLAAAPLALVRPVVHTDDPAWVQARQWEFGRRFLYRWNDGSRLLFLGRLPIVALAALLVVAVFLESRRRFGPTAGVASVLLCALSPDVLAHGSLVTTDLGFALFFFLAVVSFARTLERPSVVVLLGCGLATGAAFAAKFSAPVLALVLVLMAAAGGLGGRRTEPGAQTKDLTPARTAGALAAVAVLALAVVWAAYGFRHDLSPDPVARAAGRSTLEQPIASLPLRTLAAAAEAGLLPEDYVRGLLFVVTHSAARPTFLLGTVSDHPLPGYFLVTFLLKTPVPLLLLTAVALVRLPRLAARDALFLWLPVLVYAAATAARGLEIGHRHLLPVYPFLFLAAGEAAARLVAWRRPAGLVVVGLLGGWYALSTVRTHPHHLAYFNEIAGGPANGWRLLVDSNLDWGQDLGRLARWTRENGVAHLKLSYFGSADPGYYGLDADMLPGYTAPHPPRVTRDIVPGDVVAVSVTNLQGVYLAPEDRPLMAALRALPPAGRAGWSIRIYRPGFRWPPPEPRP